MHFKCFKYLLLLIFPILVVLTLSSPVFATDDIIKTNLWGNIQDDNNGCGVYMILNLIIDILTYGVGIAAVIGITISGITYLTAKGNEQQTIKAKKRIYEIAIGLVAYAVLYTALAFLLPGGRFNSSNTCKTLSDDEVATIRKKEKEENGNKATRSDSSKTSSNSSSSTSNNDYSVSNTAKKRKKMLTAAIETATILGQTKSKYSNYPAVSWKEFNKGKHTVNCASYAILAAIKAGLMPDRPNSKNFDFWFSNYGRTAHIGNTTKKDLEKNFKIIKGNDKASKLISSGKLAEGDIIGSGEYKAHTLIYAGKKDGKCIFHEVTSLGIQSKNKIINHEHSCSYKVGYIVHIK